MHTSDNGDNGLDRRQWPRSASTTPQLMVRTADAVSQSAVVLDESLLGVALLVKDASPFHVDQEVQVTYGERMVSALVWHIQTREDGKCRLGLEWGPADVKPASLLLLMAHAL